MKQITEDQHFVPRFYLKLFAREGQIQVLDVRAKRIGRPRPYASVCYEKFFYAAETGVQDATSQAFEDVFGQIENAVAKALPGIIERADGLQLTNDDLDVLSYFMSVQWLRTPFFRERLQKMKSKAMKEILKRLASFPRFPNYIRDTAEDIRHRTVEAREISDEEIIDDVNRLIESGEYNFRHTNNALQLNLIGEKEINGFSNLLLAKKWRIFLSEEPYHFITSDNPVAEWIPPRRGIFGATFIQRSHLLALTPRILIETKRPDSMNPEQQPVDRLSYHTANGKGVPMFNMVLANHAHQFAYAPQTDEFRRLLEVISEAETDS